MKILSAVYQTKYGYEQVTTGDILTLTGSDTTETTKVIDITTRPIGFTQFVIISYDNGFRTLIPMDRVSQLVAQDGDGEI